MKIFSETLIELQKASQFQSSEKEGNRKAGGINGQEKNASCNGATGRGETENDSNNWAKAGRPAKGEGKPEEESAPDARLRGSGTAKVDVAVQPAGHGRAKESNQRERKEVQRAESGNER